MKSFFPGCSYHDWSSNQINDSSLFHFERINLFEPHPLLRKMKIKPASTQQRSLTTVKLLPTTVLIINV